MALFGPPDVEKLKARRDVRGLVRALGYQQDRFVRMTAAQALGELGEPTTIKALVAALEDSSQDVQRAAFHALGRIGSDVAVQPLVGQLRHYNKARWVQAAVALGQIGTESAVEALLGWYAEKYQELERSKGVVPSLGISSSEMSKKVRQQQELCIGRQQELGQAVIAGVDAIQKKTAAAALHKAPPLADSVVHAAVENALRRIAPSALEEFSSALGHTNISVRRKAAENLSAIADPGTYQQMAGALKDTDSQVRRYATIALGRIGGPGSLELLVPALADENEGVRRAAADALDILGDPRATEPLLSALRDIDEGVRRSAAKALTKLGVPNDPVACAWYTVARCDWDGAAAMADFAIEPLAHVLADHQERLRREAARALARIGSPRAAEALATALHDTDAEVRWLAASAVGRNNDARAVQPLIAILNEEMSGDRLAAAEILVAMYRAGRMDQDCRELILSQRAALTRIHTDREIRSARQHFDKPDDCAGQGRVYWYTHQDHLDTTAGVQFPL